MRTKKTQCQHEPLRKSGKLSRGLFLPAWPAFPPVGWLARSYPIVRRRSLARRWLARQVNPREICFAFNELARAEVCWEGACPVAFAHGRYGVQDARLSPNSR